ncbi:MAG: hypothetical protein K2X90_01685 [Candidatus Babeliaceae bacterium]|nr:hypothetical protein [Candidatus Babeliaceae bacterium]
MKKIYFIIFCVSLQSLLQGAQARVFDESIFSTYGKDILKRATLETKSARIE